MLGGSLSLERVIRFQGLLLAMELGGSSQTSSFVSHPS
jgi:hypothetical protein